MYDTRADRAAGRRADRRVGRGGGDLRFGSASEPAPGDVVYIADADSDLLAEATDAAIAAFARFDWGRVDDYQDGAAENAAIGAITTVLDDAFDDVLSPGADAETDAENLGYGAHYLRRWALTLRAFDGARFEMPESAALERSPADHPLGSSALR